MSDTLDRHDLLKGYGAVLGENHPTENAAHDLFEAISATQTHLGVLISIYKEVTGQDITKGVVGALLMTIKEADGS